MTTDDFIARLGDDNTLLFAETMAVIENNYSFTPTAFVNGNVENGADENQGSCKVFAFANLNGLTEQQTLACFGEHYRHVLADPDGTDHANIRAFMRHGWQGIALQGEALQPCES